MAQRIAWVLVKLRYLVLMVSCGLAFARSTRAAPSEAVQSYEQARRYFFMLKADANKQRFRHHWLNAIAGFKSVAASYPTSPEAASALYTIGELWNGLYKVSRLGDDLDQALTAYTAVSHHHAQSSLADDALWKRVRILLDIRHERAAAAVLAQRLLEQYPSGDAARDARILWPSIAKDLPRQPVTADETTQPAVGRQTRGKRAPSITALKHWSNDEYSRVVIYLDNPAQAREETPGTTSTNRVVVQLRGVCVPDKLEGLEDLHDDLLAKGELVTDKGDTRVVLSLKAAVQHRLLVLENPYRVVIDTFTPPEQIESKATAAIRRHRVVIDPGHGGIDGGARAKSGVVEKNVTLAIAKDVAALLAKQQVDVVLTRNDDRYVGLEERTAIANRVDAELFVSIHVNAHRNTEAHGVETYYLDTTDDRYSLRLAARENATQEEQVSDVQLVLADLSMKADTEQSRELALAVQRALVSDLKPHNPKQRDLGVKGSLFYVLLGARMPAVLVETAFLSHPREAKLLGSKSYRHAAAAAITRAIVGQLSTTLVLAQP